MNSRNLKYAYEILDNIFEKNIAFSLGGYHSLVKQGILREFRPINDIDVNIIFDKAEKNGELIQDQILNYFDDIATFSRVTGRDYVLRLDSDPERDYYKKRVKQDKKNSEVESDVCFSISLTTESVEKYLTTQREKKIIYRSPNDLFTGNPLYNTYRNTLSVAQSTVEHINSSIQPSFYWSGVDLTTGNTVSNSPSGTGLSIKGNHKKNEDSGVLVSTYAFNDFVKKQIFDKLIDLVLSSDNELMIDFFLMEHDPKHNQVSVIDEESYTAYYPILKAKYRYCTEKFTPEVSFKKHIQDLSLSFNTKRIKGLNYPEDIELLIKNWEEMHEKDK